jgi:septal ring factor EnvC (AmiA/AmiB activator)
MIRKTIYLGVAALLLAGLFFGRQHLVTAWSIANETVDESVPVTYRLRQARDMIRGLDPEIERNMRLVARQEVEVHKLQEQLNRVNERLTKAGTDIKRLSYDLQRGDSFVYAGTSYTEEQVRLDLERRFDRYRTQEATGEKLTKILRARMTALDAAREKVKEMEAAKRQLEVEVANLAARQELVEVAQTASELHVDDSRLSQVRTMVESISTRIDVAERLVNAETHFDEIQLDGPESRDIVDEVTLHFETPPNTDSIVLD